ncbi:MAG: hypothetical protein H7A21_12905 [Spirochaetales bacterium]|nr:hypothetical protein [Leptospiraceae bacterium]MCP5482327.1 hypothetical protein [Spirochaetales bacterium]MCP5484234.1 hypothetical protein [Spirochaetales bacterium]
MDVRSWARGRLVCLALLLLSVTATQCDRYEGKDCDREVAENVECYKIWHAYLLARCENDTGCFLEQGYATQVFLNCDVLYEPVPSHCDRPLTGGALLNYSVTP